MSIASRKSSPSTALAQAARVRRRDERVAGDRDQRAHLALAGRLDLLGQAGRPAARRRPRAAPRTRLAQRPRRAAASLPARAGAVALSGRRAREHRAAGPVEVAGQHVEHVHEPARERAVLLRGRAHAARRRRARSAAASSRARRRISSASMPQAAAIRSGGKPRTSSRSASRPLRCSASAARVVEALLDQRAGHAEQQVRVAAGPDEVVLVGVLGRARAARVDHHDLAAALADAAQPAAHVGRGQQAAVRDERVGAEQQQVLAAVDVRHRHAQRVAEHQPDGDLLGHLVDGAGAEDVARAERLVEDRAVEQRREVVRGRVADVDGDRVAAVLGQQRRSGGGRSPRTPRRSSPARARRRGGSAACVSRSGSSCSCLSPVAFGQRKPREKTSSASPRTETTASPSVSISRPQVASQNGQVRWWTAILLCRLLRRGVRVDDLRGKGGAAIEAQQQRAEHRGAAEIAELDLQHAVVEARRSAGRRRTPAPRRPRRLWPAWRAPCASSAWLSVAAER